MDLAAVQEHARDERPIRTRVVGESRKRHPQVANERLQLPWQS